VKYWELVADKVSQGWLEFGLGLSRGSPTDAETTSPLPTAGRIRIHSQR